MSLGLILDILSYQFEPDMIKEPSW